MDFGAFVEILPGKEGLCHISKLSKDRVEKVTDILKEGDQVQVKLMEIDHMGRLNLAMVDALNENGELSEQASHNDSRSSGSSSGHERSNRRYDGERRDSSQKYQKAVIRNR